MRSMTGFGVGSADLGDARVRLEVRALNHRHQDIRLRLPPDLADYAFFLEQLARETLGRGRYDLSVRQEGSAEGGSRFDLEKLRSLYVALRSLQEELCPDVPLSVGSLLSIPGVVAVDGPSREEAEAALRAALAGAVSDLAKMREQEGQALQQDLEQRLSFVRAVVAKIEEAAQGGAQRQKDRLEKRLKGLINDAQLALSPERLEQELAILADRADVTEEVVRLKSHLDQMAVFVGSLEPVGRKLDFLIQEMGREVNTISSKSQHISISHHVIELKSELEKLREQVQNVD